MTRLLLAALSASALLLSGCMSLPAQREARDGKLDSHSACIAQCNRDNSVCGDQRSAQTGNTSYGMGATCQNELQSCLRRC
ncbi:hypothetical protein [Oleisolibacter albus]|uniref:hypothetical protein n=1 Tax=Oleisolibacter albus TaxID=2171757 RepID=UPI000DF3B741|nr:hypothetical protein [Oleisolibacter albus]